MIYYPDVHFWSSIFSVVFTYFGVICFPMYCKLVERVSTHFTISALYRCAGRRAVVENKWSQTCVFVKLWNLFSVFTFLFQVSALTVKAFLVLDNEGARICVNYYGAENYATFAKQLAFEKTIFQKSKSSRSECMCYGVIWFSSRVFCEYQLFLIAFVTICCFLFHHSVEIIMVWFIYYVEMSYVYL